MDALLLKAGGNCKKHIVKEDKPWRTREAVPVSSMLLSWVLSGIEDCFEERISKAESLDRGGGLKC